MSPTSPATSRGKIRKRTWVYCDEHGSPKVCASHGCRKGRKRTAYEFSLLVAACDADWCKRKHEHGKPVRVRRQYDTRGEAETELDKFKEKVKQPKPEAPAAPAITLDAYAETWLKRAEAQLATGTLKSYRHLLRLYIRPVLGPMNLGDIQRAHIKDLLASKREAKLSKNTVRLIRATLSVLFADAVDDGLLQTNPTQGLARKGRKRPDAMTGVERRQAIRPMTVEQLAAFLEAAQTPREDEAGKAGRDARPDEKWRDLRDQTLFLTLADAGLRPGEALALKWDDVDVTGRSLRIERAVANGEIKATKTGETRTVDLTARLADALGGWQAYVEAEALTAERKPGEPAPEPTEWVFPSDAGTPLDEVNVARRFRSILLRAKLPTFRLYDLRHTFATHLLAEGAPITYVAAQLGHAKPTTTLAFYAHWLPRGDKRFIDRLEAARGAVKTDASVRLAQDGSKESKPAEAVA